MRLLQTLLIAGTLTGCATEPPALPAWDDFPPASVMATRPTELPDLERAAGELVPESLERLLVIADENTELGFIQADAIEDQARTINHLREAGARQADYVRIREQQLADERREHFVDVWFHRGIIVLLAVGLAL